MPFNIQMEVPKMEAYWNDLAAWRASHRLGADEQKFFEKNW